MDKTITMFSEKYALIMAGWRQFTIKWKEQREACEKKLAKDLYESGLGYFSEVKQDKQLHKALHRISLQYAVRVPQCLDEAWYHFRLKVPCPFDALVEIERQTKSDEAKYLQQAFLQLPPQEREFAVQLYRDNFLVQRQKDEDFSFEVHQKMKAALTEFFSDEVQMLEGEHLRLLNTYTFYTGAWDFVEKLSELKIEFTKEIQDCS